MSLGPGLREPGFSLNTLVLLGGSKEGGGETRSAHGRAA